MNRILEAFVATCIRFRWLVIIMAFCLTGLSGWYAAAHFVINTNTADLISPDLGWRQDEIALAKNFPQLEDLIAVVIDGPTPEASAIAADRLVQDLAKRPYITRAWRPDSNEYLARNGLLLLDNPALESVLTDLDGQKEFLNGLAHDPSLRGLLTLIAGALQGAGDPEAFQRFSGPLDKIAAIIENSAANPQARLSWKGLFSSQPLQKRDLRQIVLIKPQLNFSALEPGAAPIAETRAAAALAQIDAAHGFTLRLTGSVPLADDEFASVAENYHITATATFLILAFILTLALRWFKIVVSVFLILIAGLIITTGAGLLVIGQLNLISVAFAVLFVGLGVDFSIQFATRYRQERYTLGEGAGQKRLDLQLTVPSAESQASVILALVRATRSIGFSLTLAALSLVAGFFCFLPTEFRGVSELGFIAGIGMIVAFVLTLSFFPALLTVAQPHAEKKPMRTASLAFMDEWILNHRAWVLGATALLVLGGVPALLKLKFDANPMNLRNAKVESVSTFLDLAQDAETAPNTIVVLAPNRGAAEDLSQKILGLPDIERVVTINTFIPKEGVQKTQLVRAAAQSFAPLLSETAAAAPTDAETLMALRETLGVLQMAAQGPTPPALLRLNHSLQELAQGTPERRAAAQTAIFAYFPFMEDKLRRLLAPDPNMPLPADMTRDWLTPQGEARVEVLPKGNSNDNAVMEAFAANIRSVAPHASGVPITVLEAGHTIVRAFLEAGVLAFIAIYIILLIAMRSIRDVFLALGPLLLAGVMTLEAAQMLGMSLNYANIIALPLMFAVGVAFHIYYLIAWRQGVTDLLASSLTRAIFFSSLTTGSAFGSLCLSSHPGTAGMGELLALSLFFTLLAAFIIMPAFLGPAPKPQAGPPEDGLDF